jgi:serine/threonine protein kinase
MKRARQSTSSEDSGEGYDDTVGHLEARRGDVINGRYEVCRELGVGTFGTVYKCADSKHGDVVALKVVRRIRKYRESARIEAKVLSAVYLRQKRDNLDLIVKLYSHFDYKGYYCLVFERLGVSLYDFLKGHGHKGLPLHIVKDVAWQMIAGVAFLHSMGIIHTDLKLENILLKYDGVAPFVMPDGETVQVPRRWQIKIIDFGGATYDNEHKSTVINTRQYRGPEVTLELGWSFPSDIWGVGCMVAEAYSGDLLFATHNNLEHLALMEHCLEPFPDYVTRSALFSKYFHSSTHSVRVEHLSSSSRAQVTAAPKLSEMFTRQAGDRDSGIVELLQGLLRLDPKTRTTAKQAMEDKRFFPTVPTLFGAPNL